MSAITEAAISFLLRGGLDPPFMSQRETDEVSGKKNSTLVFP
jgi:hypothetical protein